jgi:hypothetical protein
MSAPDARKRRATPTHGQTDVEPVRLGAGCPRRRTHLGPMHPRPHTAERSLCGVVQLAPAAGRYRVCFGSLFLKELAQLITEGKPAVVHNAPTKWVHNYAWSPSTLATALPYVEAKVNPKVRSKF